MFSLFDYTFTKEYLTKSTLATITRRQEPGPVDVSLEAKTITIPLKPIGSSLPCLHSSKPGHVSPLCLQPPCCRVIYTFSLHSFCSAISTHSYIFLQCLYTITLHPLQDVFYMHNIHPIYRVSYTNQYNLFTVCHVQLPSLRMGS